MGFFSKIKSFAGKALGSVGGVVKKFADMSQPVVKKFAELSGPISKGVEAFGLLTGQPEISAAAALINKGIQKGSDFLNKNQDKIQSGLQTASAIGAKMQSLGNSIKPDQGT